MIHEVLRKIRESSGFSQQQLAQKLGVSQTTVSGYETGYSRPNIDMIVKIANICEYDLLFQDRNSEETIKVI